MAKYDYKCEKCFSQIELERSFSDDTKPVCCGDYMTRIWGSVGVVFSGSGFYSTDNRKR